MNMKLVARMRKMREVHDAFGKHEYRTLTASIADEIICFDICLPCLSLPSDIRSIWPFERYIREAGVGELDFWGVKVGIVDFYAINNHIIKHFPEKIWRHFSASHLPHLARNDGGPAIYIWRHQRDEFGRRFGKDCLRYAMIEKVED